MRTNILLGAILTLLAGPAWAGPLRVVATTADLAAIAREIGGDRVSATALCDGRQDPHFVEPRPSMVAALRTADLVISVGMCLDVWIYPLLDAARNPRIAIGGPGFLNASEKVRRVEVLPPGSRVDASMGDVHPEGNPHYWLDPENGRIAAGEIAERLSRLSPDDRARFTENLRAFDRRLDAAAAKCREMLAPLGEIRAVSYHRSLPYFAHRFNLRMIGELEPKPGIPPSPSHLKTLAAKMKEEKVSLILVEVFYGTRGPEALARMTGARVVVFPNSVGGAPDASDYPSLFEAIARRIAGRTP